MAQQGDDAAAAQGPVAGESKRGLFLAVASIVLGAVSLRFWPGLFPLPVAGILFGMVGLAQVRRTGSPRLGTGLAAAGLLLSLAGLLVPTVQHGCATADEVFCHSTAHRLAVAMQMYIEDYDGWLPDPAIPWVPATAPYFKDPSVLQCPGDDAPPSYQLEPRLRVPDGTKGFDPQSTVLIFESDDGKNLVWRHMDGAVYAFLDGHTKWLKKADTPYGYGGR